MKKDKFYPFAFLLVSFLSSCGRIENNNNQSEKVITSTIENESAKDEDFIRKVSYANTAEIEFGKAALAKSTSKEIRVFGSDMVRDHTEAQNELKKLAKSKKITIPDTLDAEHKDLMRETKNQTSSEFDKDYVQNQVEDHKKALQLFENEIKNGKDEEVVNYAKKNIHHIQMHLDKAKKMQSSINKM